MGAGLLFHFCELDNFPSFFLIIDHALLLLLNSSLSLLKAEFFVSYGTKDATKI